MCQSTLINSNCQSEVSITSEHGEVNTYCPAKIQDCPHESSVCTEGECVLNFVSPKEDRCPVCGEKMEMFIRNGEVKMVYCTRWSSHPFSVDEGDEPVRLMT